MAWNVYIFTGKRNLKYETNLIKIEIDFDDTHYIKGSCLMLLTVENSEK